MRARGDRHRRAGRGLTAGIRVTSAVQSIASYEGRSARRRTMKVVQGGPAGPHDARRRVDGAGAERAVHPDPVLPRRSVRGGRLGLFRRHHRLLQPGQRERRHQRRQAGVGGVRNRVQRVARRRVLRAPEEEGRRREHRRAAVDRHRLRAARPRRAGQDPDDDLRLRQRQRRRRQRVQLGVPDRHQLLEPGRGDGRSTSARRRAASTSSRARRSSTCTTTRRSARSRSRCSRRWRPSTASS